MTKSAVGKTVFNPDKMFSRLGQLGEETKVRENLRTVIPRFEPNESSRFAENAAC